MQETIKEHMKTFGSLSGQPKINFPVSDNQIRSCYTQGPFSIVENLPYPSVSIAHKAAYISAKKSIILLHLDCQLNTIGLDMKKIGKTK